MEHIDCYGLTDPGRVRVVNQDQFLIADLRKSVLIHQTSMAWENRSQVFGDTHGYLLLVADGGGDIPNGAEVSSIVVRTITHYMLNLIPWLYRLGEHQEEDFMDELTAALIRCQGHIHALAETMPTSEAAGTTLTMAYIIWPRLFVIHVGNSRCYLLRQDHLEQVTTDHTLAQQLVESGVMQPQEAQTTGLSRVLWNAIGGEFAELRPEVYTADLQGGDVLLLCTDGLPRHLTDGKIRLLLQAGETAEDTCHTLVEAANHEGGTDNITVVVARFRRQVHDLEAVVDMAEPEPISATTAPNG
jgi:serine/threonine protein phosphatase PrpC